MPGQFQLQLQLSLGTVQWMQIMIEDVPHLNLSNDHGRHLRSTSAQQGMHEYLLGKESIEQTSKFWTRDFIIRNIMMQEKNNTKSPYLSTLKSKDAPFFPKITKAKSPIASLTPTKCSQAKPIAKSIFKQPQERKIFLSPEIDPQRVKLSKQYKELEVQLEKMTVKFREQVDEIQEKKSKCVQKIKTEHRRAYDKKYQLWELRNQIMRLEAMVVEEKEDEARMMQKLGYGELSEDLHQGDAGDPGQQLYQ